MRGAGSANCGHALTHNAEEPDGYGFHDALHLLFTAVLCGSPLTRKMLKLKRKSNPTVDELQVVAQAGWLIDENADHSPGR